jgi:hypothetical protein
MSLVDVATGFYCSPNQKQLMDLNDDTTPEEDTEETHEGHEEEVDESEE